jgi:DNA-binding transcriptional MocR family regulator
VLFPAIRLAYLVVPPAQVPRFDEISRTFAAGGATLMQQIVADFMNEGHFARHIQRMRRLYASAASWPPTHSPPYWASTCWSIHSRAACIWCCA